MTTFAPNEHYRSSLKRGMSGFDVWALQIALHARGHSLTIDGIFGPQTDEVVRYEQTALKAFVDGIAGPETQSKMCAACCAKAEVFKTPAGLLKGICFGESGGIIPATSGRYADGSRDYGPFQSNKTGPSQKELKEAFDPVVTGGKVAVELRKAYDGFHNRIGSETAAWWATLAVPGGKVDEAAWWLAILNYNWQYAAYRIAEGLTDFGYTETGTRIPRKASEPAPWIEQYHVPGVTTGLEWCRFYVASKSVYVKEWTV